MQLQDIFINRKKELETIPKGLKMGQNYVIIAPRRYGKTTLIRKIIQYFDDKTTIYIDIMRHSNSLNELTQAIIDACLKNLGIAGQIKQWINKINLKIDIKMKIQELELDAIIHGIEKNDEYNAFAAALELPEKLAKKFNKNWVVVFDEIGELQNVNTQAVKVLRSVIQLHKKVSYIFAGSQETLMSDIFISMKGAFYRFGIIYKLAELDIPDVLEFFKKNLLNIDSSVISYIVDNFQGHPYYTTNLFYRISLVIDKHIDKNLDLGDLKKIIEELIFDESHYLEDQVIKINKSKDSINVLKSLIDKDESLYAISRQRKYVVLKNLVRSGYVRKSNSRYILTDPLLKLYLVNE